MGGHHSSQEVTDLSCSAWRKKVGDECQHIGSEAPLAAHRFFCKVMQGSLLPAPGGSTAASEVATSSAYTTSSAGAGGQWGWSATVGAIASALPPLPSSVEGTD